MVVYIFIATRFSISASNEMKIGIDKSSQFVGTKTNTSFNATPKNE